MLKTLEQIQKEAKEVLKEKGQSWGDNMVKTTEQVEEEIKNFLNKVRQEWDDHLSGKKKDYILGLREKSGPHITEQIRQVLILIEETLAKDNLEGWKELYREWNGDMDISKIKYNGKKDLCGYLSDLRIYLENWKRASFEQSQQELIEKLSDILQVVGINPDDENIQEKVEELKKIQTDLTDLGIDKSKVKETIEKERAEREQSQQGLTELANKLNLVIENKTPAEIKEAISQEIEKNNQNKQKLNKYLPGLLDKEGKVDDGILEAVIDDLKRNTDKMEELINDNPELVTDKEIDQRKIDDFKNAVGDVLGIDSIDPLPSTWKDDLTTKLVDWEKRPTQEKLDKAVLDKEKEFENHINPDDKDKLETAAKNAGFGFKQEDIDNAVKAEQEKRKGMVSKEDYDEMVAERDARPEITLVDYQKLQDNQEKHTDQDLEHHKPEDLKPANLPDNWESELKRISTLEANQKPADYDDIKKDLKGWTETFAGKTSDDIAKRITELEKRPDISITKQQWEDDYSKRPQQIDLDKVQVELDKIKGDLDQTNQKIQGYENDLNIKLELDDNALPNWKDEIDKLKNRPTSDNSDLIKNVLGLNPTDTLPTDWPTKLALKGYLEAARNDLKGWTDKFPTKTPNEVEKENKQAVDNLQKELNNWKNKFTGKTPEAVAQELTEANQDKNKLNGWQTKFPGKSAEQVEKELNDLKTQATGTASNDKQQRKINELINLIEKQNKTIEKYGNALNSHEVDNTGWINEMVDISKLKQS